MDLLIQPPLRRPSWIIEAPRSELNPVAPTGSVLNAAATATVGWQLADLSAGQSLFSGQYTSGRVSQGGTGPLVGSYRPDAALQQYGQQEARGSMNAEVKAGAYLELGDRNLPGARANLSPGTVARPFRLID